MIYRPWITLRGVDFRRVENASGVLNFFGDGYPFHKWWPWRRMNWANSAFVAKTTTFMPQKGNMPMREDGITPKEFKPRCIIVKPWGGHTLNAVGLSGPGIYALLETGRWQRRRGEPWWMSFMSVGKSKSDRLDELQDFVRTLILSKVHSWNEDVGLEINFSCPNVGTCYSDFVEEAGEVADIADELGLPLRLKGNALMPHEAMHRVLQHPAWDGFVMGNTIPFGELPDKIPFPRIFGKVSPLTKRGFSSPGGYSGPCLRDINCGWIHDARLYGIDKPGWGCGGVFHLSDPECYRQAGADGIQLGTVAIHGPKRVQPTIVRANEILFDRPWFNRKLGHGSDLFHS